MKLGNALDFSQNEARNAVIQNLSGAPSAPKPGQTYFNTSTNIEMYWNGTAWRPKDAAGLTDGSVPIAALAVNPLARANHTGTQTSSTISDLSTVVHAYTLDSFAAPIAPVNFNSQRATGLATAVATSDAVPLQQVQNLITSSIAGQTSIKNPARVCSASNVTLSSPGTILDGVTLSANDRVLLIGQTTASQNGLYVFNGASSALTLATDANASSQWLEGTEILVTEGNTYTGAIFSQATPSPTLTTLTFTQRNKINAYLAGNGLSLTGFTFAVQPVANGGLVVTSNGVAIDTTFAARRATFSIAGDGSTTSFTITHNLNTRSINPSFQDSSYNGIIVDWTAATVNTMTVVFGAAPASGVSYTGVVIG